MSITEGTSYTHTRVIDSCDMLTHNTKLWKTVRRGEEKNIVYNIEVRNWSKIFITIKSCSWTSSAGGTWLVPGGSLKSDWSYEETIQAKWAASFNSVQECTEPKQKKTCELRNSDTNFIEIGTMYGPSVAKIGTQNSSISDTKGYCYFIVVFSNYHIIAYCKIQGSLSFPKLSFL